MLESAPPPLHPTWWFNFKNSFAFTWCIYGESITIIGIACNIKYWFTQLFLISYWFWFRYCIDIKHIKIFISFRILNFKSFINFIINMRNIRNCWPWNYIASICFFTSNFNSFISRNLFSATSNTIKIAKIKNIIHIDNIHTS